MNLRKFDLNNYLFKICEKIEYCQSIVNGHIYMKESAFFRQLDDNHRGDRSDGRVLVEWEQNRIRRKAPDGEIEEMIIYADVEYGLPNDDKMPLFCASMFDGAIITEPQNGYSLFRKEFINEAAKFGNYIVCLPLEELIKEAQFHSLENNFNCYYSKVQYFDTKAVYSKYANSKHDLHHHFPFALFKKDLTYYWQNEWRLVFQKKDSSIITSEKDYYVMSLIPFSNAQIFKTSDLTDVLIW